MSNMNNKKKIILPIIVGILMVITVLVVTYAFFNYTRTGSPNTIQVGRIAFNSTQNNTINLSNVFPTTSNNLNNTNSDTVTINITGDTTYSKGIEYKVTLEDVNNTVNGKEVPISFNVTANNLGTKDTSYYTNRGGENPIYNLTETGEVEDGKYILVGYIPSGATGVNGSIDITAYIDGDRIAISDTVSTIENGNLVYGETRGDWIAGREVFTTTEWNSLTGNNAMSFKVRVEANEGIWLEEEQFYVLQNLNGIQAWKNIRANITSIEFYNNGIAPENPLDTIDATDITSAGTVTVYTVDDGLGTNTKKAIVVAEDTIYAPESLYRSFFNMSKLTTINFEYFKVDNVTNMQGMFMNSSKLATITGTDKWNTSKVSDMRYMFAICNALTNLNFLVNWNTSSVTDMSYMFRMCINLSNVNGLINWNTSNVTTISQMFYGCTNLSDINGLINWNTSNVERMYSMFDGCTNLTNINSLINWNTSSVTDMSYMFNNCTSLTSLNLGSWNMSRVTNNEAMFQHAGFNTIIMPNNYTRIDNFMFNHNDSYTGESFTIPKSVTSIGNSHIFYDFGKDNVFKKFIVESGSPSLKTIDDIIYTSDGTRLISIPRGKTFTNKTYEIPEGVTFMNELSFSRNRNIDKLVLPNSYVIERYIDANNNSYGFINSGNSLSVAVYVYTSVKEYNVKQDNPNYLSDSGCIYSKDGTELIAIPLHYDGVLNIKSGTTTIGQQAFWTVSNVNNVDGITQINIPASVTSIDADQLTFLNSLMSRSTNPVTITIDSGNTAYQITNNQIVAK